MVKVHFIGRVIPTSLQISVRIPQLEWKWLEQNIEFQFRVIIGNSFVNVECELDRYNDTYFDELYKRASDIARTAVNLVAFATGYGLTLVLETFIYPDGTPAPITPQDPSVASLCTSYSLQSEKQQDFGAVLRIVAVEPNLFFALNDLVEAITIHHVAPVNCALAMDRLKHLIANPGAKNPEAWKQMRETLRIDEAYLKFITETSKDPRHGRPGLTPGSLTSDATRRAWTIMDRYLEYRKRGGNPLPPDEFPLLT